MYVVKSGYCVGCMEVLTEEDKKANKNKDRDILCNKCAKTKYLDGSKS